MNAPDEAQRLTALLERLRERCAEMVEQYQGSPERSAEIIRSIELDVAVREYIAAGVRAVDPNCPQHGGSGAGCAGLSLMECTCGVQGCPVCKGEGPLCAICGTSGVLGSGSAAGHTTAEFSNLSNQAHNYGVKTPDGAQQ